MYKLINQGQRSFIVSSKEVIKGGEKGKNAEEKIIVAGPKVVEVSDKLGKSLATYPGILVVEMPEGETKPTGKKGK